MNLLLLIALQTFAQADHITWEPTSFPQPNSQYPLGRCSAVAVNSKGDVYLFHRGKHPVLVVDSQGKLLRAWDDDLVGTAHGLRIDRDDNVWVTDIGKHRVLRFDPTGKLTLALGQGKGEGVDQFDQPTDVAFGSDGSVFVTDGYGNSRVLKFTAEGKFIKTWGKKGKGIGEFQVPHAVVVDKQGRVLVGDRENNRIQVFNADGEPLAQWTGFAPYGLAFDGAGRLFVADGRANQILQLGAEGQVVQRFGKPGPQAGEFALPHMLAFDRVGNLIVAEVGNQRFQKLLRK